MNRAGPFSMMALAWDGLRRKFGRNLLTMSGVFIGVLALTLIVSLGEGISNLITSTVSGEDNLRQIGLSGGFGNRIRDDLDVEIEGVDDPARRARLRRSARARLRPGARVGRRAQTLDQAALDRVAALEHVESVKPIVLERYRVALGNHGNEASASLGIDVGRRRYAGRTIAGAYLSAPDADEVLIHEYLAYQWGFTTSDALDGLVGRTLELTTLGREEALKSSGGLPEQILRQVMSSELIGNLTNDERAALPGIARKVIEAMRGRTGDLVVDTGPRTYTLKIAGVVREMEERDSFNVIEDGNAFQVDLFLPDRTAKRMYLESPLNQALGYGRALVVVDSASSAPGVEDALRGAGFTAISVASVVSRVEGIIGALTVVIGLLTGIALLVAALGIVNTMVTSVIERTGEIGLWKAVGATDGQVRLTFLLEAGLIGLVGGLLGLGTALLLMIPGEAVAGRLIAERALVPIRTGVFSVPAWLPIAGPLLATFVAMLASAYPAWRAARIDPVRALRHD